MARPYPHGKRLIPIPTLRITWFPLLLTTYVFSPLCQPGCGSKHIESQPEGRIAVSLDAFTPMFKVLKSWFYAMEPAVTKGSRNRSTVLSTKVWHKRRHHNQCHKVNPTNSCYPWSAVDNEQHPGPVARFTFHHRHGLHRSSGLVL
jgi:hypothetical protein